jgi:hypothetical protein
MKQIFRLWAKALGEKAGRNHKEADKVALIRTLIFVSYLLTNMFIVAGVIRHWNDSECQQSNWNTDMKERPVSGFR